MNILLVGNAGNFMRLMINRLNKGRTQGLCADRRTKEGIQPEESI